MIGGAAAPQHQWARYPWLLFSAGCNEQVFSPKPWKRKKISSCRFREKRKF